MINKKIVYSSLMTFIFLTGCGNDIKSGNFIASDIEGNNTGVFLDSEVEGIKYVTSSGVEGITNSKGEYNYNDGDDVEFFINDLKLGATKAENLTTVFDLEYPTQTALLLQTLDTDGNPNNGIQISRETAKQFQNTTFTIDEVNPANKEFIKKYNTLTGKDITLDVNSAKNHAISSLKHELINKVSPKLFDYLSKHNIYDISDYSYSEKNPKNYIHTLNAKFRVFLHNQVIISSLDAKIDSIKYYISGEKDASLEFKKSIEKNAESLMKLISIGGFLHSGYKNIKELTQIKKNFSATTGYINDAKFWQQFTNLSKKIILSEFVGKTIQSGVFTSSDDPEIEKKLSHCYMAFSGNPWSIAECYTQAASEVSTNTIEIYSNIKQIQLSRKKYALAVTKKYLNLYFSLNAIEYPYVFADALTKIAKNQLPADEIDNYIFLSFNQSNDADLEKALDLLMKVFFSKNLTTWDYNYNYAKQNILDKQIFVENMTNTYINNFDKSLLYDIDSEYLDIDIQIEPSESQDYFKACVNVDNISSVYIKDIRGKLNLYLDEKLIKIDNLFVGDLSHTTNTFAQRCSEEFPLTFDEKILSIGIIKAEYNFKYLPSYYKNTEEREQVGNKYFEINKHSFTDDVAKPIIKLTIPKIVRPKEKIKLDASQTVSFINNDKFRFKWEYIASNSSVDVGLTWNDTSSGIAYITIPDIPDDMIFYRHDFKLTVISETNGRESVKEFSFFVKNKKEEEMVEDDSTETSNNQDDNSDTSSNNELDNSNIPSTDDNTNNNIPSTDTPSNSNRTSIDYMKNHKTEKLASTDCKVRDYQGWKDAKNDLIYSLAPADNMMKSIEGCIDVIKLTELGGLSFSKAVESVVRSRTKETSPFSDVWDTSASSNNTDNLNVDDVAQHQNDFEAYSAEIELNTVATCKQKYGNYTFMELSTFANIPTDKDKAVGQTMNGDASYCLTLLLQSGDIKIGY